jgi:hypothetical protein
VRCTVANFGLPVCYRVWQVLLEYGEYNEQGDVSYTIANLEGSILFILGLEVPHEARQRYENSSFAAANPAFTAAHRGGRQNSSSRDITEKYSHSQDGLAELGGVLVVGGISGGNGVAASDAEGNDSRWCIVHDLYCAMRGCGTRAFVLVTLSSR